MTHREAVAERSARSRLRDTSVNPLRRLPGERAAVAAGLPPMAQQVLSSSGQPLDAGTRAAMELRFGHDFRHVRVHSDARAASSAQSVMAAAWTVGNHIAFASGRFAPGTSSGRHLLAHELAHVVQQTGPADDLAVDQRTAEREADMAAVRPSAVVQSTPLRMALERSAAAPGFAGETAAMEARVEQLISSLPASTQQQIRGRDTLVVGLVQEQGSSFRTLVYTVAGNRTYPGLEDAATRLGITRWTATPRATGRGPVGAPGDAKQILFEAAETNSFRVRALAASRDFCADCAEAIRAELGPGRPRVSPQGGGQQGGGSRRGSARVPSPGELVGEPARSRATGAVAGAALMIHQAQVSYLQRAEYQRAVEAIEALRPRIDRYREAGNWVAIIVVVSAPASVDLLRGVFTEQSQIIRFSHISLTYGITRAEAINPPPRMEAAPPGRPSTRFPDPGPNRRFRSQIAEVLPPFERQPPPAPTGRIRLAHTELVHRYALALLAIRRSPSAARAQPSIVSSQFVPFDLDNQSVQADLRALVAAVPPTEEELLVLTIALGPWLTQQRVGPQ